MNANILYRPTFLPRPAGLSIMYNLDNAAIRSRVEQLIREQPNPTQREFSARTGLTESALSKLLNGERNFTDAHLIAIEQGVGVRLEWLRTGQGATYRAKGAAAPVRADRHDGDQLKRYLKVARIPQSELATRLGKANSTVNQYTNTATLESDTRTAILNALEATEAEVFGGSVVAEPSALYGRMVAVAGVPVKTVWVNRLPVSARAGFDYATYFDTRYEREQVEVPELDLREGVPLAHHFVVEVNGDSMQNALGSGDNVLTYQTRFQGEGGFPKPGSIVVIDYTDDYDDHIEIKRLVTIDNVDSALTLRSDNGGAERRLRFDQVRNVWHAYRRMAGDL